MSIVKVNQEKCIGCGACVAIDPENFDFNDDGISTVINEIASENAKEAEEACPVLAIDIIEETEDKTNCECDNCECHNECDDEECDCDEDECNCDDEDGECDCEDCDCHSHCHDENEEEDE